jgi:hypothetical protein
MVVAALTYLYWHYTKALPELTANVLSILEFLWSFFCIPTYTIELLAPWQRTHDSYEGLNFKAAISAFVVDDIVMRLVGFVTRLIIIFFAIGILTAAFTIGAVIFLLWVLYPVIFIFIIWSIVKVFI